MIQKERPFALCDIVRETAFELHRYLGPGHLERVYENALVHRLRRLGLAVAQQTPLEVHDEDGTLVGEFTADIVLEDLLLLELKAARAVAPEHIAQVLGYLRAARREYGALLNFGAPVFHIRLYAMTKSLHWRPDRAGLPTEDSPRGG